MDQDGTPFKRPTTISKLSAIYEAKIKATQAKKSGTAPDQDTNFKVVPVNKTVTANPNAAAAKKLEYKNAPLLTLRSLLPDSLDDGTQLALEIPDGTKNLDCTFRADRLEFVIMTRKIDDDNAEWEIPEPADFDELMNIAIADFIDDDLTRMNAIQWSSVGQQTGVGLFSMGCENMGLVELFRSLLRIKGFKDLYVESFPKQTLLGSYAMTLYAHKGSLPYRPAILVALLMQSNPDLKGSIEVLESKNYPLNHATEKRRGARIISLQANQEFLDCIHEYPTSFPFTAGILKNLYIRGGTRRNTKDPNARKPPRRPKLSKSSQKRLLQQSNEEVMKNAAAADDVSSRLNSTHLNP